ncbi:MAG: FecR domain-containing protein [Candidatus Omnitrophota bacterium]
MKKWIILVLGLGLINQCFSACAAVNEKTEAEHAMVFSVNGSVKVVPYGSNVGVKCSKGMLLHAGDWVKTAPNSSVTVAFDKAAENVITIEEDSLIVIKLDGYFKVQLLRGEIYAILENVGKDETFRVLTPSVVTESLNSGWGAASDGSYTNVVVFDNRVYVCGINETGTADDKKYWIEEGFQRKTITFEDPGKVESAPESTLSWFKDQVVAHHLSQASLSEEQASSRQEENDTTTEGKLKPANNKKLDLVEYLYKQRLKS